MDPTQTTVFILIISFHLTNLISGASLGSVKQLNETFDDEEQHQTVLQNIQKNYADEFGNYEMADIEDFLSGFIAPKKKKPIYTSKTFFGSDQFFGAGERPKYNSHHQNWDPLRANRVIGSQKSYFDVPDDLFQQHIYSKNNHEDSYTKGSDNSYDFPRGNEDVSGNKDKFPFSEINFTDENELSSDTSSSFKRDQSHEISSVVDEPKYQEDELSHPVGNSDQVDEPFPLDDAKDKMDELSQLGDDYEVDELSHLVDDDAENNMVELSYPIDESAEDQEDDDEKHELYQPIDETVDEMNEFSISVHEDSLDARAELSNPIFDAENREDVLSNSLDDSGSQKKLYHQAKHGEDPVDDIGKIKGETDELFQPVDIQANEFSRSIDAEEVGKLFHMIGETQGEAKELTHPVYETQSRKTEIEVGRDPKSEETHKVEKNFHLVHSTQAHGEEYSTYEEDFSTPMDFQMDEVSKEKVFGELSHSPMTVVADYLSENQEDRLDSGEYKSKEDEIISEGDEVDSDFSLSDELKAENVIEDLRSVNMPNIKNSFENPRNDSDILPLDKPIMNESHFGKITDEHLEILQSVGDSDLMEFSEKNFDKSLVTAEDLDLRKIDRDEFQGSGDMGDDFDVLTDNLLDSKSGRLLGVFSRINNTAECITPKGERGHCLSLTQCPLSGPLNNFNLFLQYVCLSRGILVGICCPDNPVVEISDPTENSNWTTVAELKQPIDGCGVNTNTRIVGGKISLPHEWTWMVALLRRNRFFCGGVVINDWYILTAAHCVMGVKVKDLKVRLGEYNFNEKNEHQEDIPVAEIKRHALFVTLTFQHDIALLKLKRRIEYTKFIGSICLPNPKSGNFYNVNATVVGWGTVAFGGTASPVLRQVTVPVWDNDECDKTYRLERITNAFMCAGSPENGEDACQGDSGGPLMALNEEGRWEVIGLVSWGRRCGDPTFPGVYTRVTTYLDWITENTN